MPAAWALGGTEIDEAAAKMAAMQADPVGWIESVLGVRLWAKQRAIAEAVRDNPRTAVRAGHNVGKSFVAACSALWFLYTHYEAKVVTTAPTWRQVKDILWSEIRKRHRTALVPLGGVRIETRVWLGDGWWAQGLSTNQPERFQGIHAPHMLVIFDEAPGVAREIWEAAEGMLSGPHARMLAIGNPITPSGPFYDAFTSASAAWKTIHVSCLDHPNVAGGEIVVPGGVTRDWIDGRKRAWGEGSPIYQGRVLGDFPDQADSALIPLSWLDAAAVAGDAPSPTPPGGADGPVRVMGVDVARYGSDETVFLVRTESRVDEIVAVRGADLMAVAGRAKALAVGHGIDAKHVFVDEIGIGSGVVDRLREQGFRVTAVNFGAGAEDRALYINVRAECYWRLREALSPDARGERLAIPNEAWTDEMRAELTSINYTFTSRGQVKIEDKDDIRRRTGRSPDHADALALTYARADGPPGVWVY